MPSLEIVIFASSVGTAAGMAEDIVTVIGHAIDKEEESVENEESGGGLKTGSGAGAGEGAGVPTWDGVSGVGVRSEELPKHKRERGLRVCCSGPDSVERPSLTARRVLGAI